MLNRKESFAFMKKQSVAFVKYDAAKQLLENQRDLLIQRYKDVAFGIESSKSGIKPSEDDFKIIMGLISTDQYDQIPQKLHSDHRSMISYDLNKCQQALNDTLLWGKKLQDIQLFDTTRAKLLKIGESSDLSEKTKAAVLDLIYYIDTHIESGLFDTLYYAMDKTCAFLEKRTEENYPDARRIYYSNLNTVEGKPKRADEIDLSNESLLMLTGLSFPTMILFSGSLICISLGWALVLAGMLFMYYSFHCQAFHTGLSKKMLNVADAEYEPAYKQDQLNLIKEYEEEKNKLIERDQRTQRVIELIGNMYGLADPSKSIVLLSHVIRMLEASTQSELNKATDDLIQASQTITYVSFVVSLFKSEKNPLKEEIEALSGHLNVRFDILEQECSAVPSNI